MLKFRQRSVKTVDWDRTPILVGRVASLGVFTGTELHDELTEEQREALLADQPPDVIGNRLYLTLETRTGVYRVFESAALRDAFASVNVGDGLVAKYLGMVILKKRGKTMRDFQTQVFDWPANGFDDPDLQALECSESGPVNYTPRVS